MTPLKYSLMIAAAAAAAAAVAVVAAVVILVAAFFHLSSSSFLTLPSLFFLLCSFCALFLSLLFCPFPFLSMFPFLCLSLVSFSPFS